MRGRIGLAAIAAVAVVALVAAGGAGAVGVGAPGYAATAFVTGVPNNGAVGPVGLAFDSSNNLYMAGYIDGVLYKFNAAGGTAAGHAVGNTGLGGGNLSGLTFSPSGRLYAAIQGQGRIVELDPATGQVLRTVTNFGCATGIATDPVTGDLFATDPCGGPTIRISNYESGPPIVTVVPGVNGIDGITIGPDGTLYLAQEPCCGYGTNDVTKVTRPTPATYGPETVVAAVPSVDGTAISPSLDPNNPYVFGNRNDGRVTKIDTTGGSPVLTDIYSGGTRGDFSTVGPDGCLYITQTAEVVKITNADGTCSFIPTSALPQISLAPTTQTDDTGSSATVTATLSNVAHPGGTSITFTVTGVNGPSSQTVVADASGVATFTYSGANVGTDHLVATSHVGTLNVTSNTADVNWQLPPDSTPPVITPHVNGPLGDNGWYTGDTTVTWTVTDDESPVTSKVGCDETDLSGFTAGTELTCTATSAGGTDHQSVTVKIDPTPPDVSYGLSGTAGTNGWYTSPVTVTWTVADAQSGIVITCNPQTFSTDVASQTASCTARNGAGLQTSVTTDAFKIDQTPPAVTFTGNAGLYDVNQTVSIACASSDNLSGVASDTCAAGSVNAPGWTLELGSHTLSASATDNAGNMGSNHTAFTVGVTASGMCALIQQWVTNAGIANSLCVKLQNSAAARARGSNNAADNLLAAFRNEVSAQTGKALTATQASTLAALSTHL